MVSLFFLIAVKILATVVFNLVIFVFNLIKMLITSGATKLIIDYLLNGEILVKFIGFDII